MTITSDHSLPIGDLPLIHWDSSLTLILNETETETDRDTTTSCHIRQYSHWQSTIKHHLPRGENHSGWCPVRERLTLAPIVDRHMITGDHWRSQRITECHSVIQTNIDCHSLTQTPREEQRETWTLTSCPCDTGWWMALGGDSHGHWVSRVMSITRWLLAWESSELNDTGRHSLGDDTHWMGLSWVMTLTRCWFTWVMTLTGWWHSLGDDTHWVMTTMDDKDHWSLIIDHWSSQTEDYHGWWWLAMVLVMVVDSHWCHSLGDGIHPLVTLT